MIKAIGYAANHSFSGLKPHPFEREDPEPDEVEIEIHEYWRLAAGNWKPFPPSPRNEWER